jgi:hypothetical protein
VIKTIRSPAHISGLVTSGQLAIATNHRLRSTPAALSGSPTSGKYLHSLNFSCLYQVTEDAHMAALQPPDGSGKARHEVAIVNHRRLRLTHLGRNRLHRWDSFGSIIGWFDSVLATSSAMFSSSGKSSWLTCSLRANNTSTSARSCALSSSRRL